MEKLGFGVIRGRRVETVHAIELGEVLVQDFKYVSK